MKIAIIADSHFGCKNESKVLLNHFDKFYSRVFFPYIKQHGINCCIHLGDLVDRRKYINFQVLQYIREEFIHKLWRYGVDTHLILGNHDVYMRNTNKVSAPQELFTTYNQKEEPWIYSKPTVVEFDGLPIAMLPWINRENMDESLKFIKQTSAPILAAHLELSGFEMNPGFIADSGMDKLTFNKFEMVMTGHYHHRSSDGTIFYMGSPYQITWADYEDVRGFHILDTATRSLEFIPNPYSLFYKIYYDDKKHTTLPELIKLIDPDKHQNTFIKVVVAEKNDPKLFDEFMDELNKVGPANVTVVENFAYNLEEIDSLDLSQDTLSILQGHIDSSGRKIDKEKIKSIVRDIWYEAISTDEKD